MRITIVSNETKEPSNESETQLLLRGKSPNYSPLTFELTDEIVKTTLLPLDIAALIASYAEDSRQVDLAYLRLWLKERDRSYTILNTINYLLTGSMVLIAFSHLASVYGEVDSSAISPPILSMTILSGLITLGIACFLLEDTVRQCKAPLSMNIEKDFSNSQRYNKLHPLLKLSSNGLSDKDIEKMHRGSTDLVKSYLSFSSVEIGQSRNIFSMFSSFCALFLGMMGIFLKPETKNFTTSLVVSGSLNAALDIYGFYKRHKFNEMTQKQSAIMSSSPPDYKKLTH